MCVGGSNNRKRLSNKKACPFSSTQRCGYPSFCVATPCGSNTPHTSQLDIFFHSQFPLSLCYSSRQANPNFIMSVVKIHLLKGNPIEFPSPVMEDSSVRDSVCHFVGDCAQLSGGHLIVLSVGHCFRFSGFCGGQKA